MRFKRAAHITAGKDDVAAEYSHERPGAQAVGAFADRLQGSRVVTRLPNVGVLKPRTLRASRYAGLRRRKARLRRRTRGDREQDWEKVQTPSAPEHRDPNSVYRAG